MHFGPRFSVTGPGTLWLDNARLFRYESPAELQQPYTPNPTVLNELLAAQPATGPKGAHRIWVLNKDMTMASILSWHANSSINPDWMTSVGATATMTLPMALQFDYLTGSTPQTRMRPWLVLQHILHSDTDWQALIEYLAAPYDARADTPHSKPWAYQRYMQRGVGRPWTDDFSQISIEFGNETWHNGFFSDWLGFNKRNAITQGGPEYGLFCQYLIEQIKQSPYWTSQHLANKIRFNLGGFYNGSVRPDGSVTGYGEEAVQHCRDAVTLEHANYVGPKWETGDKSMSTFTDHGVQETLLGWLTSNAKVQAEWSKARTALAKAGHPYDLVAYEGGPSGYAIPGHASAEQNATNEHYGKSLAMAVSALDAWMGSYQLGWTDQCFLGYGEGAFWNSHTLMGKGFRPSPGWQALAMRNRYVSGELMAVQTNRTPTIQRGQETYPLIGVYAAHQGNVWSVIVVSRKLNGQHDGVDFGDGCTPVTIHLPIATATNIMLHSLSGDPRQTNLDAMNISIKELTIPTATLVNGAFTIDAHSGGSEGGLPPGSIYIYNFATGDKVGAPTVSTTLTTATKLLPPALTGPADGASVVCTIVSNTLPDRGLLGHVNLSWNPVPNAKLYDVQISTSNSFNTIMDTVGQPRIPPLNWASKESSIVWLLPVNVLYY